MTALYLLHTQPDPQRLVAWAVRHRTLGAQEDFGYALHGLLHAVFGDRAPKPFRYLDTDQGLLAYTNLSPTELLQRAALAPPDAAAALGLGATFSHPGLSVRPFPTQWPQGHELAFEVRVRPVVREGATGRERDAFLNTIEKTGDAGIGREAVYQGWLRDQLASHGATLSEAALSRFRLLDVLRQTQKRDTEQRRRRAVTGPDALMTGHLRVEDPTAFAHLLARGVGRHRAFGFGLLLLRPART